MSPTINDEPAARAWDSTPRIRAALYGLAMPLTMTASRESRTVARPDVYPSRFATSWIRSRIGRLTRSGFDSARDTVETATSASLATSCSVTARPPLPASGPFIASPVHRPLGHLLPCYGNYGNILPKLPDRVSVTQPAVTPQLPGESERHRAFDPRRSAGADQRCLADLDGRRGRLHPDGHAAHHPRRCRPRRRRPFRAQPGHAGRVRVHSGGRVLGSADPGRPASGPLRASGDVGRERRPAGVWAAPLGACDIHARRGCGPGSRWYRRCDRLRGDVGADPTMVPCATG